MQRSRNELIWTSLTSARRHTAACLVPRTVPDTAPSSTWASSCQQSQGEKAECDATGHLAIRKLLSLLFPFGKSYVEKLF
jgi:hypothetical protein